MRSGNPTRDDIFHPAGRIRLELMNSGAVDALRETLGQARSTNWDCIRTPHLFMGLLARPDRPIQQWAHAMDLDRPNLLDHFRGLFPEANGDPDAILLLNREFLSNNTIRVLRDAYHRACCLGHGQCRAIDMLVSLLTLDWVVASFCRHAGLNPARLREQAMHASGAPDRF